MEAKLILLKKTDGRQSFNIRLTDRGKRKYMTIQVPFTDKQWRYDKASRKNELRNVAPPRNGDGQERRGKYAAFIDNRKFVADIENQYNSAIDRLIRRQQPFSFDDVINEVANPNKKVKTVIDMFEHWIAEKMVKGKYSTAEVYRGTMNKLTDTEGFKMKKETKFHELNEVKIMKFREMMEADGLSVATIGIHLRNVRTIWNQAMKRKHGAARREDYPFSEDEDIMAELTPEKNPREISKADVNMIREHSKTQAEDSDDWHACNYFLFGYLGWGINFQDIARLKWGNIKDGRIQYVRQKTRGKVKAEISFKVTDEIASILECYKQPGQSSDTYIFPVLNPSAQSTELLIHYQIKRERNTLNGKMSKVGEQLEIEQKLTTYVWRHTFAAVCKNDLGVHPMMIGEMLGHRPPNMVTEHYLPPHYEDVLDNAVKDL